MQVIVIKDVRGKCMGTGNRRGGSIYLSIYNNTNKGDLCSLHRLPRYHRGWSVFGHVSPHHSFRVFIYSETIPEYTLFKLGFHTL